MRKLAILIPALAAVMLLSAAPARSDEGGTYGTAGEGIKKDECLLVAMNCVNNVDSVQQRIDRLQKEIAKGTDVYTRDELRILNDKLDEANRTYFELLNDRPTMDR
ncbi:MAG TPA: hypothetical protein VIH45_14055 [Desulfuromonadaceae bacterium]